VADNVANLIGQEHEGAHDPRLETNPFIAANEEVDLRANQPLSSDELFVFTLWFAHQTPLKAERIS
jgi:hypothetical protein